MDKTGAVLRRLVIIPFNATFSKDDPDYDPFIKYKLIQQESVEYFIRLGVEGLKRIIINDGFTKSDKVQNQLTEYEEENNPILAFINDTGVDMIEMNQPMRYTNGIRYFVQTTVCSQCQTLYSASRSTNALTWKFQL